MFSKKWGSLKMASLNFLKTFRLSFPTIEKVEQPEKNIVDCRYAVDGYTGSHTLQSLHIQVTKFTFTLQKQSWIN